MRLLLLISLLLFSLGLIAQENSTRYSRAVKALDKKFIKPIAPKLPELLKLAQKYEASSAKLTKSQQKKKAEIIFTLKKYSYVQKLTELYNALHKNIIKQQALPESERIRPKTAQGKKVILSMRSLGKALGQLARQFPECHNNEEIKEVIYKARRDPNAKPESNKMPYNL